MKTKTPVQFRLGSGPTRCPIVGSKFYPPAIEILLFLPIKTPLLAIAEPTNPYDPNAIQVWIETKDIPQSTLNKIKNSSNLLSQSAWQLGHIAADFARILRTEHNFPSGKDIPGTFDIGTANGNRILLTQATWTEKKEPLQ